VSASRYRLIRTIASGGMAQVYEATAHGERGFSRRVAVKRIRPQHAGDEAMRRMFFDEARIAGRLHHANIVQVLDYGEVDGDDFIVMEYVDGIDADRAVARAPMPDALALYVVSEVAHALAYAHSATDEEGRPLGIVHRDVSPHNMLFSWEGHVKLADFGIALAAVREEKTRTGIVKGKLAYMAPEQARGVSIDGAADVYALGATLHALINGAPPRESPREPFEIDPALSPEVRELVVECMRADPAARPSADALADRAARLANRALARDARGALREWLAPLRSKATASALDDLMGLMLVATEGRRYTVSREAHTEPVRIPTRRYGAPLAIATLVALAGVAMLVAWSFDRPHQPRVARHVTHAIARPVPAAPPSAPMPIEPPAPPVVPSTPISHRAPRSVPRVEPPTSVPPVEPPATPVEAAPAYLRIPRVGSAAERIEIDGRARGFTPSVIRVDAGEHRVAIRDAESGAIVLQRSVTARATHSALAPLVIER
jgi:serine/threonine-protein kinase